MAFFIFPGSPGACPRGALTEKKGEHSLSFLPQNFLFPHDKKLSLFFFFFLCFPCRPVQLAAPSVEGAFYGETQKNGEPSLLEKPLFVIVAFLVERICTEFLKI
jgi:hypothetical protein